MAITILICLVIVVCAVILYKMTDKTTDRTLITGLTITAALLRLASAETENSRSTMAEYARRFGPHLFQLILPQRTIRFGTPRAV